ncbi:MULTISPECIES: phage tail sheath family protein [Corallincola]|uniref:Phage tail sheath family protein n=3 Tax=Corallincola TaxID=1775176 RepID=A0A368NLP9_9GAMM|nr:MULTISPECIES: phage tail sheath C-terminal domain-containing protein [Corallincola]RCU50554.1 phage tail sheath family protein [Corallincola holothuriorum]TAA48439.1 phage tail sheath family protein [Corallincola spongiicola]TCI01878.1 phage tail sheath family protein [Corallincola luteus]
MASYNTPGVYIEEITKFPPSVAAVETAIPAFIGFTEKAEDENGNPIPNTPTRITSMVEYEARFGRAPLQAFSVDVSQKVLSTGNKLLSTTVSFDGTKPRFPPYMLYYSMLLYFANGGGPCYVVSIGDTSSTAYSTGLFTAAITKLEEYDEPTLYLFPDACSHRASNEGTDSGVGDIIDAALTSCAKLQDRFTIADVRNAVTGGTDTNAEVTTHLRGQVLSDKDIIKYGAAYFPYLDTSIDFLTGDGAITINTHTVISVADDGTETSAPGPIAADTLLSDASVVQSQTTVYNAVKAFLRNNGKVTLPPSAAVAGVYARVDASRGVWKAPANVGLALVDKPAVTITNDINDGLNVDPGSGKSVNAIRAFAGKGVLVWGARTLAGNDNEWRYVPVRRFFNFVEESIKKATSAFVFEPNDANTWVKVRTMIENFLVLQWRDGALAGAKPEDAFYVHIGLNQTMTADDILNGYMNVEIGMAVVRPAEFIVLKFSHKMQES